MARGWGGTGGQGLGLEMAHARRHLINRYPKRSSSFFMLGSENLMLDRSQVVLTSSDKLKLKLKPAAHLPTGRHISRVPQPIVKNIGKMDAGTLSKWS